MPQIIKIVSSIGISGESERVELEHLIRCGMMDSYKSCYK